MKRAPHGKKSTEKRTEKRKKPAERSLESSAISSEILRKNSDFCRSCTKSLIKNQKTLYVEEEQGRVFCSEACIIEFFSPEIKILEDEYLRWLDPEDLSVDDRERFAYLRWNTLQCPEEVWRETTARGDYQYSLISEFHIGSERIWSVAICLFLRGEPSFLLISFPTRDYTLVERYRRGTVLKQTELSELAERNPTDGLASKWTEDETYRAKSLGHDGEPDIAAQEWDRYQHFFHDTLTQPDEVWSHPEQAASPLKVFHFLKAYPQNKVTPKSLKEGLSADKAQNFWFVIVARELGDTDRTSEGEEQIEILDAFPTRKEHVADRYRKGCQDIGLGVFEAQGTRLIH